MDIANKVIELSKNSKNDEAANLIYSELTKVQENVESDLKTIASLKESNAKSFSQSNGQTAHTVKMLVTVLMAIGVIAALVLGIFMSSSVSKPITEIMYSANKIAEGDLDIEIKVDSKDEIGILKNSFKKMADHLNEVIKVLILRQIR